MLIVTKNRIKTILEQLNKKFCQGEIISESPVSIQCEFANKEYDIVCFGRNNPLIRYHEICYDDTISDKELEGIVSSLGITVDDEPCKTIELKELLGDD